ncbi:glycoside hydrolase family 2 [Parabacteroides goldsteinii]|uniref:glycosyl hydrolase n=1 Tax=Parabacteroides goldsteinii TaxID=328812 RepID=UPI001CCF2DF5|nr:glycosyl hydrolase [Parabacteroides goldsteinii]UBD76842.1 glycoside hydrolase family 2 [Parabacteroides goldsteinii]
MAKITHLFSLCILVCLGLLSCNKTETSANHPSFASIEQGFRSIPDSVQTGVYWYWISDNISKEGVERDLEAMKVAGINRAFIGNIGIDGIPYGDHKLLSSEWWEVLHAALKKATELNIEIGIFNSPGWSQSGGPWVKSSQAMRYLASSDTIVAGPGRMQLTLPSVGKDEQDVCVIAYPALDKPVAEKSWAINKKSGQSSSSVLVFDKEATVRTLIYRVNTPFKTTAKLWVKKGGKEELLRQFVIDRSNPALNVGFVPYAPVVISLPETSASQFRLEMSEEGEAAGNVTLTSSPMMERYPEKSLAKMFQTPLPMWDDYLWEKQPAVSDASLMVSPDAIKNVTEFSKNGVLDWEVPEGKWVIRRMAMLPTGVTNSPAAPEATGPEIDKMSKKHVAFHFDAFIGDILKRIPEADRKTFKVVVQDSYETGGQNWTDDMISVFKERYGYDPVPYLPVLEGTVVGNPDISDRFLWDLRRLIADRVSYDYVGGLRDVCHQHGLTTWLENYGHWGFPGEFLQYGGQSDEIAGEFWSEGSLGDIENRAASSCGHIYGKRRVWAESFTSGGPAFGRYPYQMKQRGDRFFTEGINSSLLHVYIHQPFEDREPGLDAWFGNEFNRKNTWFSQMDVFTGYLKRCNFMLQRGDYVADVAYFIGEDAPKMTGICTPELPVGYSFDYINGEVLLQRASVEDGRIVLPSGMKYRLLVLPQLENMRPEILQKIKELLQAGACVIGPAPKYSPSLSDYPAADRKVQALASELWGDQTESVRTIGKGRLFMPATSLQPVLEALNVKPDMRVNSGTPVLFIHRATDEGDIYFISNQSENPVDINPSFRVAGKLPELWNPLTAEIRLLPEFTCADGVTTVPVRLEGFESSFIIFRKKGTPVKTTARNYPVKEVLATVTSPWQVDFEKGKRGPEEAVTFPALQDWTESTDPSIRYFSGKAIYTNRITLDELPQKALYLDLGKVMVMAKVKINGQYVGGVWTTPYRLPVGDFLRKGENLIEVEVVNNWRNRLIGDASLPEKERGTWTNVNPWNADSPLQSSGLIGPVEIQAYSYE